MNKYDLILKHKKLAVYDVKEIETWLDSLKSEGYKLFKIEKGKYFFKKSEKLDFEYFIAISEYTYKNPHDISSSITLAIDTSYAKDFLTSKNIKYHLIPNDSTAYVYQINAADKTALHELLQIRYALIAQYTKEQQPLYIGLIVVFGILAIICFIIKELPVVVLLFLFCILLLVQNYKDKAKLNSLKP